MAQTPTATQQTCDDFIAKSGDPTLMGMPAGLVTGVMVWDWYNRADQYTRRATYDEYMFLWNSSH